MANFLLEVALTTVFYHSNRKVTDRIDDAPSLFALLGDVQKSTVMAPATSQLDERLLIIFFPPPKLHFSIPQSSSKNNNNNKT